MKYVVLTIVGAWFAFLTVTQSFHVWERLLVSNAFSFTSMAIVAGCTALIGFGYTRLFIALADMPIPRMRTFTYCIVSGIFVFAVYLFVTILGTKVSSLSPLQMYIAVDMYLRTHHGTVITYMDFGNTELLVLTTLWWTLIGAILTAASAPTKNRTWIKRLEVSRSIR